jgi:hypothetical protein
MVWKKELFDWPFVISKSPMPMPNECVTEPNMQPRYEYALRCNMYNELKDTPERL